MSHVIYPTTNFKATEQLKIEHGEGVYIYDNKGNRYLEGMAGLWCTSLGYGNEEVIEAASEQMRKLTFSHMFGGKAHQPGIDLADKLSDLLPMDNAMLFFGTSGSDANDTQIKLLRYYFDAIGQPQKYKIIARERSYHGVTVAAASLTGLPVNQQHFHLPFEALGILRTDHPHYYRGRLENENEGEFVERIIGNLVELIEKEGADSIAAFIAEPITGASGVIVPPPGYYEKLREVLEHYKILLWADEVITGFGRTGHDFGVNTMNMGRPDMMTLAKQLSSAYVPISAAAIRGDMYEAMVEQSAASGVFGHGYTYSGHPLGCAVALKVLEIYQRDRLFEQAAQQGKYLQQQLATFHDHPLVGEIRGRGLIGALELVADKATGRPFADGAVGAKAQQFCQDNGLILRSVDGSSLAFCPPLIISQEQIDEMIDKTRKSLNMTLDFCQREQLLV